MSRTAAERMASPERLNLDRRGLTACPLLQVRFRACRWPAACKQEEMDARAPATPHARPPRARPPRARTPRARIPRALQGEERLRLLNYQNNQIQVISNLHTLPFLIFLDLYNNQIRAICGLEQVPSLRVLMLGKNQIEKVERLDALTKLDVLDLHCNKLQAISGLAHLCELRVLNLAGNQISQIEAAGLRGLASLAELNLRRNVISAVSGVDCLPALQRLFLSYNQIGSVRSVASLGEVSGLLELALDGNPLAIEPSYRSSVLELSSTIRHLGAPLRAAATASIRRHVLARRHVHEPLCAFATAAPPPPHHFRICRSPLGAP